MQEYSDFLKETLFTILKTNMVFFSAIVLGLIIAFILRKKFNTKKIQNILITFLVVIVTECCILTIPRLIDINTQSYIVIENAELDITATQSAYPDGSVTFYGVGYVIDPDGNSHFIVGLNFFDLSLIDETKLKNGQAVYAKYSRQLISFEHNDKITNEAVK